jgi:hypothetical protein
MGTLIMSDAIGVDAAMPPIYVHHEVSCAPRHWSNVAEQVQNSSRFKNSDGHASLYGIWRSKIGLPRAVLTIISVWPDIKTASLRSDNILSGLKLIKSHTTKLLAATVRPKRANHRLNRGIMHFAGLRPLKIITINFYSFARRLGHFFKSSLAPK